MASAARSAAPPRRPPPRRPSGTPISAAQSGGEQGQLDGHGQPVEDHPADRLVLAEVEAEVPPRARRRASAGTAAPPARRGGRPRGARARSPAWPCSRAPTTAGSPGTRRMSPNTSTLMPQRAAARRGSDAAAPHPCVISLAPRRESGAGRLAGRRASRARPLPPSEGRGGSEPGVLEAQLERGQRHRPVDVRLHPVALDLVAEDDQRAFLLEAAHQLRVHLLARGRARRERKASSRRSASSDLKPQKFHGEDECWSG